MTQLRFVTNTITSVNETTYDGKPYLIAPVVAIREGVLNDMLVLAEEFGKYPEAWNGRPVPLSHPKRNGEYVSANSPDIWANETPGTLWNVALDGDRLKGEIWIDLEKAEKIGEPATDVVERLRAGDPIEVSTGYFADLEETAGTWNGKSYIGIARNIRPDHLALLPNEIGACSWEDGCGTPRVNKKGEGMEDALNTNELTLDDRAMIVRRAFWQRAAENDYDSGEWVEWDVVSVFGDTLIAKDWGKKVHVAFPYTLADNGDVTFGEPSAVDVVYRTKEGGIEVVVANAEQPDGVPTRQGDPKRGLLGARWARFRQWLGAGKPEGITSNVQEQEEADVKKCEIVAALVANKQCKFSKEKLESWSEEDLTALHQTLSANAEDASETPAATPAVEAPVVQLPEEITQFAEMLKGLGGVEALGSALGAVTANANQERAALVAGLVANEQCRFDEADLQAMSTAQLNKLADSLQVRDYAGGVGVIRNSGGNDEQVLAMPSAWGEGK